jgi:hypothetical protein
VPYSRGCILFFLRGLVFTFLSCAALHISQRGARAHKLRRGPVREQHIRLCGLPFGQFLFSSRLDFMRVLQCWTRGQLQFDRLRGCMSERAVQQQRCVAYFVEERLSDSCVLARMGDLFLILIISVSSVTLSPPPPSPITTTTTGRHVRGLLEQLRHLHAGRRRRHLYGLRVRILAHISQHVCDV